MYVESKEGHTYLRTQLEDKASHKLLSFIHPQEMAKWAMKIRKIQKKMKQDPKDEYDTEFVDVDTILMMYMDEYRSTKRTNQKRLQKFY